MGFVPHNLPVYRFWNFICHNRNDGNAAYQRRRIKKTTKRSFYQLKKEPQILIPIPVYLLFVYDISKNPNLQRYMVQSVGRCVGNTETDFRGWKS